MHRIGRLIVAAAIGLVAGVSVAAAMEPTSPDQIPPATPLWKVMKIEPEYTLFLEEKTLGRVGDTGYAWLGRFYTDGDPGPLLLRLVIDCPTATITADWAIIYTRGLVPGIQQGPNWTRVAENHEDRDVVRLVCDVGSVFGLPLIGMEGAASFARTAPFDDGRIAPAVPDLQFVGWQEGTGHIYLDTSESYYMTKVARVWLANVSAVPTLEPPLLMHWLISCTDARVTPDWQVAMNANQEVVSSGPVDTPLFTVNAALTSKIIDGVCAGMPLKVGEEVGSIDDAMIYSGMDITDRMMEELTSLPEDYPPQVGLDLVEVYRTDVPLKVKVFAETNSVRQEPPYAFAWVFYAFKDPQPHGSGQDMAGFWAYERYDCRAPLARQQFVRGVGYDDAVFDKEYTFTEEREVLVGGIDDEIRTYACFGTAIAAAADSLKHFDSVGFAVFDTLTWQ